MEKIKLIAATIVGVVTLGVSGLGISSASANNRPNYCPTDHDHRSHNVDYYNYYSADRYSRNSRSGLSITISSNNRATNNRANNRSSYDRRANRGGSKVVKRKSFNTRYNARVLLEERIVYGRRSNNLICTLSVRGRDAGYVTNRKLRRIANNNCSRRASIRINA